MTNVNADNREPVNSSSITAVGYAAQYQLLEIEFRSGAIYQYFAVSPEAHRGLLDAESVGRHFVHRIKRRYRHLRIMPKK